MDNTKYKSVSVPNNVHETIKVLADKEGRTIGGQMTYIIDSYLKTVDRIEVSN